MARHPFDATSFLFGGIFVLAGLLLLSGTAQGIPMSWAGPIVAVLLGVVILVATRPRHSADLSDREKA